MTARVHSREESCVTVWPCRTRVTLAARSFRRDARWLPRLLGSGRRRRPLQTRLARLQNRSSIASKSAVLKNKTQHRWVKAVSAFTLKKTKIVIFKQNRRNQNVAVIPTMEIPLYVQMWHEGHRLWNLKSKLITRLSGPNNHQNGGEERRARALTQAGSAVTLQ